MVTYKMVPDGNMVDAGMIANVGCDRTLIVFVDDRWLKSLDAQFAEKISCPQDLLRADCECHLLCFC